MCIAMATNENQLIGLWSLHFGIFDALSPSLASRCDNISHSRARNADNAPQLVVGLIIVVSQINVQTLWSANLISTVRIELMVDGEK